MKNYFNLKTIVYLLASIALSFAYSLFFGYSIHNVINGLTFITLINAIAALNVYSRSKGDVATMTYNKTGATVDYDNHRSYVIEKSKGKTNPFIGSFILLLIILIIIHQFNIF